MKVHYDDPKGIASGRAIPLCSGMGPKPRWLFSPRLEEVTCNSCRRSLVTNAFKKLDEVHENIIRPSEYGKTLSEYVAESGKE